MFQFFGCCSLSHTTFFSSFLSFVLYRCISGSGSLYTPGELQMWRIAPAHSQRDAAQQLPPSNGESEGPVGSIIRTFGWPWSSQTGTTSAETQSTVAHLTGIMSLALAARDTVLVSSAGDNAAAVWDVHSGQCLQWCQGHVGWITCLAVSPHVRCAHDGIATKRIHFITGGHDGRALLWDTSASVGDASSNESVGADQNDVIIARSQFPCVLVRGAGHDEDFVPQSVARASCRHILRHGEAVNGCAFSGCGDFAFTSRYDLSYDMHLNDTCILSLATAQFSVWPCLTLCALDVMSLVLSFEVEANF